MDERFRIMVGKAKAGVRTEAQYNAVDRITNFIVKHTGGVFTEQTVAVGVAAVYGTATKFAGAAFRKASGILGGAGALAGMQESRRLERERAQHAREMAQGRKLKSPDKAKRRKELEESRIQFKKFGDIKNDLEISVLNRGSAEFSEAEYNEGLKVLADLEARVKVSNAAFKFRSLQMEAHTKK